MAMQMQRIAVKVFYIDKLVILTSEKLVANAKFSQKHK